MERGNGSLPLLLNSDITQAWRAGSAGVSIHRHSGPKAYLYRTSLHDARARNKSATGEPGQPRRSFGGRHEVTGKARAASG